MAQIDAVGLFELLDQVIHHAQIKVVASQEGITIGGAYLEDSFAYIQDGNIEGAAAEVVDRDGLILFLVQPICQGGSGRFVNDAQHLKPGDTSGVFGGVAL